jgi:hypothetical protein
MVGDVSFQWQSTKQSENIQIKHKIKQTQHTGHAYVVKHLRP